MKNLQRKLINEKLKTAPESLKKMYLNSFERMSFQNEDEFEGFLSDMDKDLEGIAQDSPSSGHSGAELPGKASKEEIKKIVDNFYMG